MYRVTILQSRSGRKNNNNNNDNNKTGNLKRHWDSPLKRPICVTRSLEEHVNRGQTFVVVAVVVLFSWISFTITSKHWQGCIAKIFNLTIFAFPPSPHRPSPPTPPPPPQKRKIVWAVYRGSVQSIQANIGQTTGIAAQPRWTLLLQLWSLSKGYFQTPRDFHFLLLYLSSACFFFYFSL